jgi:hypothetical protein
MWWIRASGCSVVAACSISTSKLSPVHLLPPYQKAKKNGRKRRRIPGVKRGVEKPREREGERERERKRGGKRESEEGREEERSGKTLR